MALLALDTALQRCSAAIVIEDKIAATRQLDLEKGHAEVLAPMVDELLKEFGGREKLEEIAVIIGPGGFTGVRVGLAFARGLALGTPINIRGVSSLEALASNFVDGEKTPQQHTPTHIAPIIDARRGEVYGALYQKSGAGALKQSIAPFVDTPKNAYQKLRHFMDGKTPLTLLGSGAKYCFDNDQQCPPCWKTDKNSTQININAFALYCAKLPPTKSTSPSPLYLRPPDAKPSSNGLFSHLTPLNF